MTADLPSNPKSAARSTQPALAQLVATDHGVESDACLQPEPSVTPIPGLAAAVARVPETDSSHELVPPELGEESVTGAATHGLKKRTRWQRESDLLEVAELMQLRHGGCTDIARTMNARFGAKGIGYTLSSEQVRQDMKEVRKRWADRFMGGTARQMIAAELALLDRVEHEAWELYKRSQRDESRGSQTTRTGQGEGGGVPSVREVTKVAAKAQRDGEIGPLLLLVKTSERRAALLGLESVKLEVLGDDDGATKARMDAMTKAYRAKVRRDVLRELELKAAASNGTVLPSPVATPITTPQPHQ